MSVDEILAGPQFRLDAEAKERALLPLLTSLTRWHQSQCEAYARMLAASGWDVDRCRSMAQLPYVPIGVFKRLLLSSVSPDRIFAEVHSSGTSGQAPSRIVLDRRTAELQSRALAAVMREVLPGRIPMLLLDREAELGSNTARGVGIRGMLPLGRSHAFAMQSAEEIDLDVVQSFLSRFGRQPFVMFGFTFVAWTFLEQARRAGLDLSQGTLIHSGGWKRLAARGVSNADFKAAWLAGAGVRRVFNFYGMVEQVGSVFLEGEDGFLYAPACADVIVRDPATWLPAPQGVPGVLQVVSALPHSYPGHSILTEDLGVVHAIDGGGCGRLGTCFSVLGRVPRAEVRGCSDVAAVA